MKDVRETAPPSDRRARPCLYDASDHVHVWRAQLDQPAAIVAALSGVLSDDERARARRFRSDSHRDHFIVCRAAQRDILGVYADVVPEAITFQYSAYGKPSLDGGPERARRIRFNTSNSGQLGVFAVTLEREVGIDVEADRAIADALPLARRFFSPAEFDALLATPAEFRHRAFLTCWTRKEAFIKAVGLGVSMPLDGFDVTVRPDEPAALRCTRPDPSAAERWSMHALDLGPGYFGALVVEGTIDGSRFFEWRPTALRDDSRRGVPPGQSVHLSNDGTIEEDP